MAKSEPIIVDLVTRTIQTETIIDKLVEVSGAKAIAERDIASLRDEVRQLRSSVESKDSLIKEQGRVITERGKQIEEMRAHRKKQEAACSTLFEKGNELLSLLQRPLRKKDAAELRRRVVELGAALNNVYDYCDRIPF